MKDLITIILFILLFSSLITFFYCPGTVHLQLLSFQLYHTIFLCFHYFFEQVNVSWVTTKTDKIASQ